jgi:hypothetical protein
MCRRAIALVQRRVALEYLGRCKQIAHMSPAQAALQRLGKRGALRALSREASVSSGLLSLLASGERALTADVAERLVSALRRLETRAMADAQASVEEFRRSARVLAAYTDDKSGGRLSTGPRTSRGRRSRGR